MPAKQHRGRNVTERVITYTCDAAQLEAVTTLARKAGIARNEFIRRAIDEAVKAKRAPAGRDRRLSVIMSVWPDLEDGERRALELLATSAAEAAAARKAQALAEQYEAAADEAMTEQQRRASRYRSIDIEYQRACLARDVLQGKATAATAHELWDSNPDRGRGYADWINHSLGLDGGGAR